MNLEEANSKLESAAASLRAEFDDAPVGVAAERAQEIVMNLVAFHRVAHDEADDEIADALGMSIREVWSVWKMPGVDAAMTRIKTMIEEGDPDGYGE